MEYREERLLTFRQAEMKVREELTSLLQGIEIVSFDLSKKEEKNEQCNEKEENLKFHKLSLEEKGDNDNDDDGDDDDDASTQKETKDEKKNEEEKISEKEINPESLTNEIDTKVKSTDQQESSVSGSESSTAEKPVEIIACATSEDSLQIDTVEIK